MPGCLQIGQQDAPGHAVHGKVMRDQHQATGLVRAAVAPHRLQQDAVVRVQPGHGIGNSQVQAMPALNVAGVEQIDAGETILGDDGSAGRDHGQRMAVPFDQPQAQGVVAVEQRLQRSAHILLRHACRGCELLRLMQTCKRASVFDKGAHDRQQRQLADGVVALRRRRLGRGVGVCGQCFDLRMLEYVARRDQQAALACAADQTDGADAVATQFEEAGIDAHFLEA
ncbi:hypothetical protein GCM10007863_33850 [Dyella mobilis]|nr:hypothetical protein GCM10007863_33850 [Dyella mobilis]